PNMGRRRFPQSIPRQIVKDLKDFIIQRRPVVILSTIPERSRKSVIQFLKRLKAPIYAEGLSGLRGHPELREHQIRSGEKMLAKLLDDGICDAIFRIGGVPTVRLWRDLEDRRASIPVFSIGYNHYTGLSRKIPHYDDLDDLSQMECECARPLPPSVLDFDREQEQKLVQLYEKYPQAEPALVHFLSRHLKGAHVYLGNSLPVREWDMAVNFDVPPERVVGNRGANGIDGQISTFLGWSQPRMHNWAIVGDLTALYDLPALWITPQLDAEVVRIVVLNNGGGMIFKRMFGSEIFLNQHKISFAGWAEQWGWDYQKWERVPGELKLSRRQIIEISVSQEQTANFWQEWERLW
ncbi:MAG: 2-succinyl-5-enolpyruvyl-6-hydroxy-3-cyclohexene-1-carboxylate synthase, partial [Bdellovibrionaceae bacterium]|nr:2-succinyl-5-enolpyruvyl-6-hydroxy-3-cyclohexene-1-carboxylate synthase [Pseudobdellovibrionaceae bacterium]